LRSTYKFAKNVKNCSITKSQFSGGVNKRPRANLAN